MSDQCLTRKEVRTRKPHLCEICNHRIRKGAKAIYWTGVYDGDFQSAYAHGVCEHLFHQHFDGELPDPYDFRTEILGLPLLKARNQ